MRLEIEPSATALEVLPEFVRNTNTAESKSLKAARAIAARRRRSEACDVQGASWRTVVLGIVATLSCAAVAGWLIFKEAQPLPTTSAMTALDISAGIKSYISGSDVAVDRATFLDHVTKLQRLEIASQVSYVASIISSTNPGHKQPLELARMIVRQARLANYDPLMVTAVIKAESSFKQHAISNVGAQGLMQLMPATAKYISDKSELAWAGHRALKDPEYNIKLGIAYLKYLENYFGGNRERILIAYNWGPANLMQALKAGRAPLPAARQYAAKIINNHQRWDRALSVQMASNTDLNVDKLLG
jgi:soluble lytic murein transglycosylase